MTSTIIDDEDSSHVTYTGTWIKGGTPHELDGTVASSTNVGDYFTVNFNGISIAVYGTIDSTSGGVLTDYLVDGATAQEVASPAGSGDTYNQLFWQSPTLAAGNHSMKVTMVKVNDNSESGPGEGTIWFDYFLISNGPTPSSMIQESSSTSSITTQESNPPPSSTIQGTNFPPSSSTFQGSNSPIGTAVQESKFPVHRSHTGAIAGVVAGVVIILLAALAFAFIRFRRRRDGAKNEVEQTGHPALILDGAS